MAQKPPAFQFYPRNWLTSRTVAQMSRGDQADFMHLLCHAWLSEIPGSLPYPSEAAAKIVGWKASKLRHFLRQFPTTFVRKTSHGLDAFWNEVLLNQYDEMLAFTESKRFAGIKGNAVRWHSESQRGRPASASSSVSAQSKDNPGLTHTSFYRQEKRLEQVHLEANAGAGPSGNGAGIGGFKVHTCASCGQQYRSKQRHDRECPAKAVSL
jgi:hypothetical protein